MKFVLLNGPPGSGKDFAAKALMLHFCKKMCVRWERFSRPNKHAFGGMVDMHVTKMQIILPSGEMTTPDIVAYYEAHKDEVIQWLGVSFRQWQIDFAEKFMKPLYGKDIFVRLFISRNTVRLPEPNWLCVVSDCGFQIEFDGLVPIVGRENILLLRLHRDGHSFANDSREWVFAGAPHQSEANGVNGLDLINCGTHLFTETIIERVGDFIGATP